MTIFALNGYKSHTSTFRAATLTQPSSVAFGFIVRLGPVFHVSVSCLIQCHLLGWWAAPWHPELGVAPLCPWHCVSAGITSLSHCRDLSTPLSHVGPLQPPWAWPRMGPAVPGEWTQRAPLCAWAVVFLPSSLLRGVRIFSKENCFPEHLVLYSDLDVGVVFSQEEFPEK